ncbi:hypothetical protein UCREL1_3841 [Eutypa lata UCREL1]|uniref:Uncharacterized protein n=1 Tax=Eutypa lata (strain UCR-EL1) TaxID=1287681 RepID=M7SY20_EUTLA|nr:hypothetical protein UCREL1_3841 [Eutypa lata UCREL1]
MSSTKSRLDMTLDELAAEAKAKANKAPGGKRGRSEGETAPTTKRAKPRSGEDQSELTLAPRERPTAVTFKDLQMIRGRGGAVIGAVVKDNPSLQHWEATSGPTSGAAAVNRREALIQQAVHIADRNESANRGNFQSTFIDWHGISSSAMQDAIKKVPVHEMIRRRKELEAAPSDKGGQPASSGKSGKPANAGGETAPAGKGKGKRYAPKLSKATQKTEEEKKKELDDDMIDYFARNRQLVPVGPVTIGQEHAGEESAGEDPAEEDPAEEEYAEEEYADQHQGPVDQPMW